MDLYITDSLQDMLDMDIKNEIATDLSSITDFSVSITFDRYIYFFLKLRIILCTVSFNVYFNYRIH